MPALGRAVIDTNTFVSAGIRFESIPSQAVEKALRRGSVLRSIETWQELQDVLQRDKHPFRGIAILTPLDYLER
jgi:predicted nucleic acid-binding protein